jgi:hypothetical protein
MEIPTAQTEEEAKKQGEEMANRSAARSNIAVEQFLAKMPKSGKADIDQLLANVARTSYLAGRNEVILSIMSAV